MDKYTTDDDANAPLIDMIVLTRSLLGESYCISDYLGKRFIVMDEAVFDEAIPKDLTVGIEDSAMPLFHSHGRMPVISDHELGLAILRNHFKDEFGPLLK